MKRIIILSILLLCPSIVFAEIKKENIESIELLQYKDYSGRLNRQYITDGDYIIFPSDKGVLNYNKKTGEIKEIHPGDWDTKMARFAENYIALSRTYDSSLGENTYKLTVFDKTLKIIKEKQLPSPATYSGYSNIYAENDKVYVTESTKKAYTIDNDLNITALSAIPSFQTTPVYYEEFQKKLAEEKVAEEIYRIERNEDGSYNVILLEQNENRITRVDVRQYDKDKKYKGTRNIFEGEYENNSLWGLYIAYKTIKIDAFTVEVSEIDGERQIKIYDENGNIVKEINNEGYGGLVGLINTSNGFIIVSSTVPYDYFITDNSSVVEAEDNQIAGRGLGGQILFEEYGFKYIIETKTDGNGTIDSRKTTVNGGEEVEFIVSPKEGYVLGAVKVTDTDGNIVTFTDYKFTMPNANVIIEATFIPENSIPENPNTKTFVSYILIFVALTAGLSCYILGEKKRKFYKW